MSRMHYRLLISACLLGLAGCEMTDETDAFSEVEPLQEGHVSAETARSDVQQEQLVQVEQRYRDALNHAVGDVSDRRRIVEQGVVPSDFVTPLAQSTTGPKPPLLVRERDMERRFTARGIITGGKTIDNVPAYNWRHGCGPTAVGMVVGYYDGQGYDLIPGSASSQTNAVNQAIASGGTLSSPNPAGSEEHLEDYGLPKDDNTSNPIADDAYITASRTPHADNCIADYMDTSKSTRSNRYGWSWNVDIGPSFVDYVAQVAPTVTALSTSYYHLSWNVLKTEIDNNRPMVFLVDTDGSGGTDHFITVIGYREIGGNKEYACHDTWSSTVRWEDFAYMTSGQPWGIYEGYSFSLSSSSGDCTSNAQCDDNVFCNGLETCVDGTCRSGIDFGAGCYNATPISRYGYSGNFNTTGDKWFVAVDDPNGWWTANMSGRTVEVNGQPVSMNQMPLPTAYNGERYFHFSAGSSRYASWGYW